MSCGGRVYKGDSMTISIPFDVSGYTDLTVSYFTIGDTKIVKDESGLTVADGYITAEFSGHDLDLLPDGVVRYTIEYAVDNTDYVESSNTMLFLKTLASYNSITPEEIYQSGYTAGYDDCGEGDCSEIQNIAYNSGLTVGYESGYTAGQDDCPLDCDAAYNSGYTQGYQGGYGVGYQGGYSQGYQGGYSQGQADCPDCPACDCTEAYQSGLTVGAAEQKAEDDAKITPILNVRSNGTYVSEYGYGTVNVNVPKPQFNKTVVCIYQGSITIPQDTQFSEADDTVSKFFYFDYAYVRIGGKWEMEKCGDNDFLPAGTYALQLYIQAYIRDGVMSPVYVPIKEGSCTVSFNSIEVTSS